MKVLLVPIHLVTGGKSRLDRSQGTLLGRNSRCRRPLTSQGSRERFASSRDPRRGVTFASRHEGGLLWSQSERLYHGRRIEAPSWNQRKGNIQKILIHAWRRKNQSQDQGNSSIIDEEKFHGGGKILPLCEQRSFMGTTMNLKLGEGEGLLKERRGGRSKRSLYGTQEEVIKQTWAGEISGRGSEGERFCQRR